MKVDNSQITKVKARKIFDSRGKEAIEIDVIASQVLGRSSSPSGASTGRWEVRSYPDGGVKEAIKFIEDIVSPKIAGNELDVKQIDLILHEIDESTDFNRLGGNTAYAISLATAIAGANSRGVPRGRFSLRASTLIVPCVAIERTKHKGNTNPDN